MIGFVCLFGSLYPLTQIYQFDEDSSRGDRTLARILGVRTSLVISAGAATLAFAAFSYGLLLAGPTVMSRTALGAAGAVWAIVLGDWILRQGRMTSAQHQRGMYRALGAWALTDVAMVLAFAV